MYLYIEEMYLMSQIITRINLLLNYTVCLSKASRNVVKSCVVKNYYIYVTMCDVILADNRALCTPS